MSWFRFYFSLVRRGDGAPSPSPPPPPPPPPPPGDGDFDDLAAYASWVPTTGTTNLARPTPTAPSAVSAGIASPSFIDQRFGTAHFYVAGAGSIPDSVNYLHHTYSRVSPFERNDNGMVAGAENGYFHFFEGDDFSRLTTNGRPGSPGGGALKGVGDLSSDFIMPPPTFNGVSRARKLWYGGPNYGSGLIIKELDIDTGVSTNLIDLTGRLSAFGATAARLSMWGEGQCSADGDIWAFIVANSNYDCLGLLSYKLSTDTILGTVLTSNRPNHISVSPDGNWIVPSWSTNGSISRATAQSRPISTTSGVRAYNQTFSSFTQINAYGEHSDLAIDAAGNMAIATNCFAGSGQMADRGITDGDIYYAILSTGVCHKLDNLYLGSDYANHFSGQATARPGWVAMSYHGGGGSTARYRDGTIGLQELVPAGARYVRLAHHQGVSSSLGGVNPPSAAPLPAVNRDLTRVAYTTNFRSASGVLRQMMIGLPSDWDERL